MPRPIQVTFVGAGGNATLRLVNDFLKISGNAGSTLTLVNVDAGRLDVMHRSVCALPDSLGISG